MTNWCSSYGMMGRVEAGCSSREMTELLLLLKNIGNARPGEGD